MKSDLYEQLTPQQKALVDRWCREMERMFPLLASAHQNYVRQSFASSFEKAKEERVSFKDLEKVLEVSEPKFRDDPYKFAFIRCLREINGNLDSIALFQKSHLELLGQIARELNQTCELQVKLLDLLARMIDQQIQALNRTNELTEKNFAQAASYVEELKPKHTGLDDGPPNSIKRASKK